MGELVGLYEKVAALGFPFMLSVALVGSRLKVWYWGWWVEELRATLPEPPPRLGYRERGHDVRPATRRLPAFP